MESGLLDRLETWKSGYGSPATGEIERLLAQAARTRVEDAGELIRLHETLLFLRAYPHSAGVAHHADRALAGFGKRVEELRARGADLSPLEEPELSGIAGSELCAVFGYETARHLARRHAHDV